MSAGRSGAAALALCAAVCAAVGGATTAQAAVSFTAPHPAPVSGLDLVVSDFDRDGRQDLATSNSNGVNVAFGDGSGGFDTPTSYSTEGSIAIALTAADFDGADGPDLAVVDGGTHRASILLNDGEGGFALHGPHHPTGTLPGEVAAGDFDDDGHLDLAVSRYWDDVVRILPGDGAGSFGAGVDVATGDGPRALAVGDMDGDGIDDIVTADHDRHTVSVLLGGSALPQGAGFGPAIALMAPQTHPVGVSPMAVALLDADGDAHLDIAAANAGSDDVSLLMGDGAGGFSAPEDVEVGDQPVDLAPADLDEDGSLDMAVATLDGIDTLLNDGSGGMTHDGRFDGSPISAGGSGVTATEFNENGEADLAVLSGGVNVLLGDRLFVDPGGIDFGVAQTGTVSAAEPVAVFNSGTEDVQIGELAVGGLDAPHFAAASNECAGATLAPGEGCVLSLRFEPGTAGFLEAIASLESDAPTGPHDILLFGESANAPELIVELDGQELLFPRVAVPEAPFEDRITLRNPGPLPVSVGQPVVEGGPAFSADGSLCAGAPLEEGEQCDLIVRFDPPAPGVHRGQLVIHSDAEFSPHRVSLVGTGSGSLLDFFSATRFGRVSPGGSVQRRVRLTNRGPDPAAVSLQITGSDAGAFRVYENPCPASVPAGSSCLVGVEFAPARPGVHSARLEATAPSAPVPAFIDLNAGAAAPAGPVFPRPVDLRSALAKALTVRARSWRGTPRRTLRRRGFAARFVAPGPGTLRLELRRAGRLVARGASQGGPGRVVARARTTPFGRRLLQGRRALTLTARLVFVPANGARARTVRAVRLPAVRR